MRKNLQKLQEKMKALQRQMKEAEKMFYVELGKEFEIALNNQDCTVEQLRSLYQKIKKEFGR